MSNNPSNITAQYVDLSELSEDWITTTLGSISREDKVELLNRIVENVRKASSETLEDIDTFDPEVLKTQFEIVEPR